MTFGMIVGNRGFFPDHLAKSGREEMIAAIQKAGHTVVAVGPEETKQTVSDRGFGLWLEDLAMGMQAQGLAVAGGVLFLFGPNHALSVRVHRKVENGKESFRLTGHDANSDHCGTGNHKAMEAATPQDFRPMSLGQFFERFTTHYQGLTSGIPTVTIMRTVTANTPISRTAFTSLNSAQGQCWTMNRAPAERNLIKYFSRSSEPFERGISHC